MPKIGEEDDVKMAIYISGEMSSLVSQIREELAEAGYETGNAVHHLTTALATCMVVVLEEIVPPDMPIEVSGSLILGAATKTMSDTVDGRDELFMDEPETAPEGPEDTGERAH